jgi:hypothetical protein
MTKAESVLLNHMKLHPHSYHDYNGLSWYFVYVWRMGTQQEMLAALRSLEKQVEIRYYGSNGWSMR